MTFYYSIAWFSGTAIAFQNVRYSLDVFLRVIKCALSLIT
jgi:hypothetical protein